jgi:hypothetical protein
MSKHKQREQWTQDVSNRQRSVVFPQTLANEVRFWRNIGGSKPTALTWAGLAIFGLSVFAFGGGLLVMLIREGALWGGLLTILLIFGPIFGLIGWATRRNLRNLENSRRKR